jgi:FtsH-binding integral membrane protein
MNFGEMAEVALATVGVTELIKNFVGKGGKKVWSLVTILVGGAMSAVSVFCPEIILQCIVGVSGAVVFYDTIFKAFQKLFSKIAEKGE